MSMRFIDMRLAVKMLLVTTLLAGCSAPQPVPPSSAPPAPVAAKPVTVPPTAAPAAKREPSAALKKQFAQAVSAMQDGKDKKAEALFTAIAEQDPQLASPHTNLGILFYREDRLPEAEASFKEALQRNDQDYVAANYLGMIYRIEGHFAEAQAAYERALAAKPDYGYAHLNMAILYDLYMGKLDLALDHYQQYRQSVGDADQRLAGWLADLQQRMKSTGASK
jgi:tetratricopeptide (TPR) repeat protein